MRIEDMILVSVDDHIVEPPDMWEGHLSARWKPRAPRLVHKKDGVDVWVFEGAQLPNIGLNAVAGRPPEEYGMEPTALEQLRPGNYDVHARVADMNANGVLGSLNFPSVPGFCGQLFARQPDKELARTMLQAYNDWHIETWCAAYPERFIPLAIPVMWDVKLAADEVRRVAKKGCHAMSFADNPMGLGYPSFHDEHWNPLWEACCDEGTILCLHIGSGTGMALTDPRAPVDIMISTTPVSLFSCATDLVFSQLLRRYPKLKFALSEGGIGWIPYFLERIDYVYQHHRYWTNQDFGTKLPSEVFREHCVTCFIDDPTGVRNRDAIGIDTITWECDYPHSDTTWPKAPEILTRSLGGVSDRDVNKITHENALRHFRFDPFSRRPRKECTVGALRAEAAGVDLSLKSSGGAPPAEDRSRVITVADIQKQLAKAFATPFESAKTAG